jgi:hypothetical protein
MTRYPFLYKVDLESIQNFSGANWNYENPDNDCPLSITTVWPVIEGILISETANSAPSSGRTILPLADFGTAYFGPYYVNNHAGNGATVNGQSGGIAELSLNYSVYQINMVQRNGSLMAQTSSLQGTDSFYVTWESS